MKKIKVYLNTKKPGQRRLVNAELIEDRIGSVVVKLPDGNVIVRRKNRDLVEEK